MTVPSCSFMRTMTSVIVAWSPTKVDAIAGQATRGFDHAALDDGIGQLALGWLGHLL